MSNPDYSSLVRVLCNALAVSYTLINTSKDAYAPLAEGYARHIEDFCRDKVPEAFGNDSEELVMRRGIKTGERAIDEVKVAPADKREKALPKERNKLLLMHRLLEERSNNRARELYPTALLKNLVMQMIETELSNGWGRA